MSNTPTDVELDELIFDVYPTYQAPEALDRIQIREAMKKAVAKCGSPQPVVREPLTDEQLAEMMRDTWGCASIAPRHALEFARAVERAHGIPQKGCD